MTDKQLYDRRYWEGGLPDGSGYHQEGYRDFPVNEVTFSKLWAEKPESFLEIGAAKGYIVRRMQIAGIKAAGVDISEYCVATRVANSVVQCDITKDNLPFSDKEFDLSFSKAVLEHIEEEHLEHVIKEIARVSKRGFHCPSFNNIPGDTDKTHRFLVAKEVWEAKFKQYAPDFPVKIIDKEEIENAKELSWQTPQTVPQGIFAGKYVKEDMETMNADNPTRYRALNIGSWTVMYASTPDVCIINTDVADLRQYAGGNGYNYIYYKAPDRMPFKDNTISAIYCSHMLEHLDRKEGAAFLKECLRVLRPGSSIRILVPNTFKLTMQYNSTLHPEFGSIMEHTVYNIAAEKSEDDAEALFHLLLDGHKTIYDAEALASKLEQNGFVMPRMMKQNDTGSPVLAKFVMDMYPEISLIMEAKKPESESSKPDSSSVSEIKKSMADNIVQTEKNNVKTDELANTGIVVEIGREAAGHKSPIQEGAPTNREVNKICLVSTPMLSVPPKSYGGLEKVVYDLAFSLAKMGKDVTVIAPTGSHVEGCKMFDIGPEVGTVQVDWKNAEARAYEKYKELLINGKFDVIHSHNWFHFPYLLKEKYPELPICATHHGGINFRSKPPFVKNLNLFAISRWMQTVYASQGFPAKICYNGIDISEYPLELNRTNRLLFVGRLDAFKRPHLAINVARAAGFDIDIVGGTFVQDKNYTQQVLKMCHNHAKAHPDASQKVKIDLMQHAKAIIMPSQMGEPMGLVACEAMATGCPVICSNDGALPEVVQDGITGFVCKTEQEMVQAVKKVELINPLECRARVEKMFTREIMAQNYLKLYSEIVV